MEDKVILSFDQASQTCGWSLFKGKELQKYGHKTFRNGSFIERLSEFADWSKEMIKYYKPDYVAFEEIQLQNGAVTTYKILAKIQGVLELICFKHFLNSNDYIIVSSNTWKSYLDIKKQGRAQEKKNAQEKVMKYYSIDATEDEADAICIGKYMAEKHFKKEKMFGE